MEKTYLSAGAVRTIAVGEDWDNPILQVLGQKKISSIGNASDRYRLLLSDGIHTHSSTMLATQLNNLIHNKKLETFTIIRLEKFVCNLIPPDKRVVIVLDVEILAEGEKVGSRLGNPVPFKAGDPSVNNVPVVPILIPPTVMIGYRGPPPQANGASNQSVPSAAISPPAPQRKQSESFYNRNANNTIGQNRSAGLPITPGGTTHRVVPIESVTPYQNRWTIRARVTQKSDVRTWSNSRGEGKLFNINLLDASGEIKATAFKDQVDQFYDQLELNKVYYISKASVKQANKQYSSLNNEYEMTFNQDTMIVPCTDVDMDDLPKITFNFKPINQLMGVEPNSNADVMGVIREVHDLTEITTKATQKQLKKRELQIVDQSGVLCQLTMWGKDAENFDGSGNPIIAVKGARVSDWAGRSLSIQFSSQVVMNPDLPEAHSLRGWYDSQAGSMNFSEFKSEGGSSRGQSTNWTTFKDVKNRSDIDYDKPYYFTNKAIVVFIKKENVIYKACPTADCNKKLIEQSNGMTRCEKCAKDFPPTDFKYRMILNMNVADHTDSLWVTGFQETGEAVLSEKADELGRLKEADDPQFENLFTEASFKEYMFRYRGKMETYNDETRLKTVVMSISPIVYKDYNKKLIQDICKIVRRK